MEAEVLHGSAVAVACALEAAGLELMADGDRLVVRPRAVITPDLDRLIRSHKHDLLSLLRMLDDGVIARREQFTAEWRRIFSSTAWPRFIYRRDVPYVAGYCFSCGDANDKVWGRWWRCRLAWRLAVGYPQHSTPR
jgi:hypothetical protein